MDFLESAAVMIPALTDVPVTIYGGDQSILVQFEQKYCFSPVQQRLYTAVELEVFLMNGSDDLIYDLEEPLDTHFIAFRVGERWALIGPYVESEWNSITARALLAKIGVSESATASYKAYRCKLPITQRSRILSAAQMVIEHMNYSTPRKIRTILVRAQTGEELAYPSDYENSAIVNRRYTIEDRFITAVSRGETDAAKKAFKEFDEVCSDLRFISDDLRDRFAEATIWRTVTRTAAKRAGLNPVLIDSISQEYAQKMRYTTSAAQLKYLATCLIERFCVEVQVMRENNYSPPVRKAIDYISANLSQQMTVTEIAKAVGVDRHRLVTAFGQETNMTMKQYMAQRRCDIAAELLESSGASIQEIAAYVGYPDNCYFSRVFKASRGVTPQDYRSAHGLSL